MNSEVLVIWLDSITKAMGHGGKLKAAKMLGLTQSRITRILKNPEKGFNTPTIKCMSWILSSKSSHFKDWTLIKSTNHSGYTFEVREKDGEEVLCWKKFEEEIKIVDKNTPQPHLSINERHRTDTKRNVWGHLSRILFGRG